MSRAEIELFFFESSGNPLFGCYHAPQSGPDRQCSVVLCYPMGQEYILSHRAYRQLAVRLSDVGFPVLRFDFYGCGDSSGNCEQGQIRQWLNDILTAIGEIRGRCGVVKVCLVGLRLGGTLSMMVGAERGGIEGMVLWDPVVSGRAYIEELTTLHPGTLQDSSTKPKHRTIGQKPTEILGFPITNCMLTDLENIDLCTVRQKPANSIFVVESNGKPGQGRLREHLKSIGAQVEYQHLPGPIIWKEIANQGLVPHHVLQSMVSWISEVYS